MRLRPVLTGGLVSELAFGLTACGDTGESSGGGAPIGAPPGPPIFR